MVSTKRPGRGRMENVRGKLTYRRGAVVKTLNFDLDGPAENDDLVIAPTIGTTAPGEHWTITVTPRTTVKLLTAELRVPIAVPPSSRVFVNGYQTWTESREMGPRDRILHSTGWPAHGVPCTAITNTSRTPAFRDVSTAGPMDTFGPNLIS